MKRKEREIKIIYVYVLLVFAGFLAIPIIQLLLQSFRGDGAVDCPITWKSSAREVF